LHGVARRTPHPGGAVAVGSVPAVDDPTPDAPFDVGIAGAGQLARMTALAAWPLGIRVGVLGAPGEPAGLVAAGVVEGDWHDAAAVAALGRVSRVVTLENEFVDARALAAVEAAGTPVRPRPAALATVQDKALQKERLRGAGLPVPRFVVADGPGDLPAAGRDLGWPAVLKSRTLGYDGYGNATCSGPDEAAREFGRLDRGEGVLVEAWVPFTSELAAMVARSTTGEEAVYPVVETVQRDHVCHEVIAPAPVEGAVRARAHEVARAAAAAADGLGVTGVEMFLLADGAVLVNELAPRPHNSGHYTIEACETSQFENHLRGVLGLPLGPVHLRAPAAAMVNLLGSAAGPSRPDLPAALAVRGAHVHLYDKAEVRVRRKMGHVTALGDAPADALRTARAGARAVGL
jgi:5-(carboxyamino)imidazole ribonucleotide synthase